MEMKSSSELRMDRLCHRCGNPISWWDRFRGYKLQCPSCEKIVSSMVADRILNLQKKEEPVGVAATPSMNDMRDSQDSWSAASPSPSEFTQQMRRAQGQMLGTAFMGGISNWRQQTSGDWTGQLGMSVRDVFDALNSPDHFNPDPPLEREPDPPKDEPPVEET